MNEIVEKADRFRAQLAEIRSMAVLPDGRQWYAYDILSNVWILNELLDGGFASLLSDLRDKRVADIGAADGDFSFFLETLGIRVDIVDNPPTNANGLVAARVLKEQLESDVGIIEVDLDQQFALSHRYDLIFFLGILYHLKNPFYALEHLARRSNYLILSTRIAQYTPPANHPDARYIADIPVAYLLGSYEANNDPTNYWIFTEAGLRRVIDRSGWNIIRWKTLGAQRSDPATTENDERAYCLLRSRFS